jgi:hypothetical protein
MPPDAASSLPDEPADCARSRERGAAAGQRFTLLSGPAPFGGS